MNARSSAHTTYLTQWTWHKRARHWCVWCHVRLYIYRAASSSIHSFFLSSLPSSTSFSVFRLKNLVQNLNFTTDSLFTDRPPSSPPKSRPITPAYTRNVQPGSILYSPSIFSINHTREVGFRSPRRVALQLRHGRRVRCIYRMRQRGLPRGMVPLEVCPGDGGARWDVAVPDLQSQCGVLYQAIGERSSSSTACSKDQKNGHSNFFQI